MTQETTQQIAIRLIGNAHAPQAAELILSIQQGEFNIPVTLEGQPDLQDIERFFYGGSGGFWGAFEGDRLVGTIGLLPIRDHGGVIRKMFVHKDYRGRPWNIAQQLLETLLAHCRAAGIEDLYLGTVEKLQAAARFYERNGFVKISKASLPPSFPLMSVDNTFYHLHIGKNGSE